MADIGTNILRARIALGWSQDELARRMGYKSRASIHRIEKGSADIPQSKIAEFADVLGTSPAVLMGLVDDNAQKRNDVIAKVVLRMRTDESFRNAVMRLYNLEEERLEKVNDVLALL